MTLSTHGYDQIRGEKFAAHHSGRTLLENIFGTESTPMYVDCIVLLSH